MRTQDEVREFILAESKKVAGGKGMLAAWSRAVGKKDSYLFDFINKRTPKKLDEDVRAKLAEAMKVDEAVLRGGDTGAAPTQSSKLVTKNNPSVDETSGHNARIGTPIAGFTRVPIRGRSMGGKDGVVIFDSNDFLGEVEAPAKLHGVPDAYAAYVIGDSMLERYQHGEVVFVHPYAPVQKGDDVVVQVSMGNGEAVHAWVKRFVSRDDKILKVRQLNPKKVLTFPAHRVVHVHKIVMGGPA